MSYNTQKVSNFCDAQNPILETEPIINNGYCVTTESKICTDSNFKDKFKEMVFKYEIFLKFTVFLVSVEFSLAEKKKSLFFLFFFW